ncbi:MAG: hypothetical protein SFV15_19300 [Polyangiaceae bacterium]|nr:hypothetical protein [Polyangiaceae bacterium]
MMAAKKKSVKVLADPHAWSKDALLAKAQRFAEEMASNTPDDWRFMLWSTLALELLARAALANVSPTLLAEKEWPNVYYALGHQPKTNKFVPRSIDITAVFTRLREAHTGLDPRLAGFGVLHMHRRNEELHSGRLSLDNTKNSTWLPIFYETCEALLVSMDETLNTLFDDETVATAQAMIAAARDQSSKAVEGTIRAHKTVWAGKSAPERKQLVAQATAWATRHIGHRVKCPACECDSILTGVPTGPPNKTLKGDEIIERQTHVPSRFECVACGLKISGLPQLHASNLGDTFTVTYTYEAAEYYAPDDPWEGYEPDNNEP